MADNTFSSYPTPPKNVGEISSRKENSGQARGRVEVLRSPSDFQKDASTGNKPLKLEGKVTRIDPQTNRVTIQTQHGEFEVRYPKDQKLPVRGAQVEITLSPAKKDSSSLIAQIKLLPPTATKTDEIQLNSQDAKSTAKAASYKPSSNDITLTIRAPKPLPLASSGQAIKITPLPPAQIPLVTTQLPPPQVLASLIKVQLAPTVPSLPTQRQVTIPITITPAAILPAQTVETQAFQTKSQILTPLSQPGIVPDLTRNEPVQSVIKIRALPITLPAQASTTALNNLLNLITTSQILPQITPNQAQQILTPQIPQQPLIITATEIQTASVILTAKDTSGSFLQALQKTPDIIPATPSQSTPSTMTLPQSPTLVPSVIVGFTQNSQPVLAILSPTAPQQISFFTLQNVTLPIGSQIQIPASSLAPLPTNTSQSTVNSVLPHTPVQLFKPDIWPALNDVIEILQQVSPQLAQNIINIIPSARSPAQIPPGLLLFIAAIRGGDLSAWVGEKPTEILQRLGKADLLSRLGNDFTNISRASSEQLPNDWRGLIFPFHAEADLKNIALFYKQDQENKEHSSERKQTRFIFDMDLSRMGFVQIDGLFKPYEKAKRLDIVVRTETALSEAMKQNMRQSYAKVLTYSDISGEIRFQDQKENFIQILAQKENVKFTT